MDKATAKKAKAAKKTAKKAAKKETGVLARDAGLRGLSQTRADGSARAWKARRKAVRKTAAGTAVLNLFKAVSRAAWEATPEGAVARAIKAQVQLAQAEDRQGLANLGRAVTEAAKAADGGAIIVGQILPHRLRALQARKGRKARKAYR